MRHSLLAGAVIAGTLGFAGLAQAYTAPPPPPGTPGIEPGTPFNADPNRPSLTEPGTGSTHDDPLPIGG